MLKPRLPRRYKYVPRIVSRIIGIVFLFIRHSWNGLWAGYYKGKADGKHYRKYREMMKHMREGNVQYMGKVSVEELEEKYGKSQKSC